MAELATVMAWSLLSPCAAATRELSIRRMFGVALIWSTKYCDIRLDKESPRTIIVTLRVYLENII